VTERPDWIVVYPEIGGPGNGSLTLNASPKATYGSRSGTITLQSGSTSQNIAVTQQGAPPLLALSSSTFEVGRRGGSKYFEVDANLEWTATRDQTWFIVSPAGGNGDGAFSVIAEVNTTPNVRDGTVAVTGGGITQVITVTQEAQGFFIDATPGSKTFGGSGGSVTVTVTANVNWTITKSGYWFTVSRTGGSNNGSFTINASRNPYHCERRSGKVTINGGPGGTVTISLYQNKGSGSGPCQ